MNTIHSSSLAYYPVARKAPQSGYAENGEATARAANNGLPNTSTELNVRPSSPEQIRNALAESGLSQTDNNALPANAKAQRALNAYTQNYNQLAQRRVTEMVSGIDLYA